MRDGDLDKVEGAIVAQQVIEIHKSLLPSDKENLKKRVLKYQWYRLQDVPLDELEREVGSLAWNPEDTRVDDYAKLDQSTMPPIVLGRKLSSGLYEVVDGFHRAAARRQRGDLVIKAYVPMEASVN